MSTLKNLPKKLWRECGGMIGGGIMIEYEVLGEVRPGIIKVRPSKWCNTQTYWHHPDGYWTVINSGRGIDHYFDKNPWLDCADNTPLELIAVNRHEFFHRGVKNTHGYFIPKKKQIEMYSFSPGEIISYEPNFDKIWN